MTEPNSQLATITLDPIERICKIVLDALQSPNTRRAYSRGLHDFLNWYAESGEKKLTKAVVRAHLKHLQDTGVGAISINVRLAAIKKLCNEAADNGALSEMVASAVQRIEGIKVQGQRLGNWLTKEQAQALLHAPDNHSIKGLRDRAILAVLLGAGLRREELVHLRFDQIQMREARWVIVDLKGKGNKSRAVPISAWCKAAIDRYAALACISEGIIFRSLDRKCAHPIGENMTPQAIYNVVREYAPGIAPHDMRRSFAKLSHKGGSPIEQIQLNLGHANLATTERYLGTCLDLVDAPCDHLGLSLAGD